MKTIITMLILLSALNGWSQYSDCTKTIQILKKLFPKNEVKFIEAETVFFTEVWDHNAAIPVTECAIAETDNNLTVIAFEIYLSDDPSNYENMIREDIFIDSQINETTKYQGYGERLIQVIFYDLKNDKFIGKPDGFPLAEMTWINQDMNGSIRTDRIVDFKAIENCTNTFLLSIEEFETDPKKMHYFFKYLDGKILVKSLNTCIESIQEQKNLLMVHHIENCTEVEEEGAEPENVFRILFRW